MFPVSHLSHLNHIQLMMYPMKPLNIPWRSRLSLGSGRVLATPRYIPGPLPKISQDTSVPSCTWPLSHPPVLLEAETAQQTTRLFWCLRLRKIASSYHPRGKACNHGPGMATFHHWICLKEMQNTSLNMPKTSPIFPEDLQQYQKICQYVPCSSTQAHSP